MSSAPREITEGEMCHERLGDKFATALSNYDTQRRIEVLVDEFLGDKIKDKNVLDVGCGLGFFSNQAKQLGGRVTACDIGPNLVERTVSKVGCEGQVADAMALTDTFGKDKFDIIVSSECIEHTPDPEICVREMLRVLKPGGYIALSTPNLLWYPVVRGATLLRLRPFDGHENFSTWRGLSRIFEEENTQVIARKGLHLFPFQLRMHGLSTWLDENAQFARGLMINICLLGQKNDA